MEVACSYRGVRTSGVELPWIEVLAPFRISARQPNLLHVYSTYYHAWAIDLADAC